MFGRTRDDPYLCKKSLKGFLSVPYEGIKVSKVYLCFTFQTRHKCHIVGPTNFFRYGEVSETVSVPLEESQVVYVYGEDGVRET